MNNPLNFFDNLYGLDHWSVSNDFDFLNSVLDDNLFSDYWDFVRLFNDCVSLNDPFDNLRNFNYLLDCLNDWNGLLDYSINNLMPDFNMVFNLFCISVLYLWDNLFNDFFNFNNLWNLNNLFNNLFDNDRNFNDFFDNFGFRMNDYFLDNLDLSDFNLDIVLNLFDFNNSLNLNDLFDYFFDCYDFWNLSYDLNDSLNYLWNFNNSFDNLFDLNNFFNDVCNNDRHLQRNIDDFLYFFDSFNFDNFLSNFVNCNNLRNLDNSIDNLLYNLLNFNNFGYNSEDFEDIVNIDNTHDFLSDHSDNSFIHFENDSSSNFNFL